MTAIHTVPTIDNEASGPSYSVTRMCQALKETGCNTQLAVLEPLPALQHIDCVKAFAYGAGSRRLGHSPAMAKWLRAQALSGQVDVFHNHSLWMLPNIYPVRAVKGTGCKLIISPRGTLSPRALKRSRLFKRAMSPYLLSPPLRNADAFHATSEQEYHDIRAQGLKQAVAILPNGVELPTLEQGHSANAYKQLLFLGRIHPIKGIDNLLRAWVQLQDRFPDWQLNLAGPDEGGYKAKMEDLAKDLNAERCTFSGAVFGQEKRHLYQRADLYVLPTHTENFGQTVAEALSNSTPVITTKGAPWQGLETKGAGWWIDIGVEPLVLALANAMAMPKAQLNDKGAKGRDWMQKDFSWNSIAKDMASFYAWLAGTGKRPDFVKVD